MGRKRPFAREVATGQNSYIMCRMTKKHDIPREAPNSLLGMAVIIVSILVFIMVMDIVVVAVRLVVG